MLSRFEIGRNIGLKNLSCNDPGVIAIFEIHGNGWENVFRNDQTFSASWRCEELSNCGNFELDRESYRSPPNRN